MQMYFVTSDMFKQADLLAFVERVNERAGWEAMVEEPDHNEIWDCFRKQFTDHMPCDVDYALESISFLAIPGDVVEHLQDCAPPVEFKLMTQDQLIQNVRDALPESRAFLLEDLAEHLESDHDDLLRAKCEIADDYEIDMLGDAWREARRDFCNFEAQAGGNLALHAQYVIRHVHQLEHRLALAGQGFDFVKRDVVDFEDPLIATAINNARAIRLTDKLRSSYCAKDDDGDPTHEMEDWLNENCPDWRLELNTQGENYFVFSHSHEPVGFKLKWG